MSKRRMKATETDLIERAKQIKQEETRRRHSQFAEKYNALVKELGVQLAAVPSIVPVGNGMFTIGTDMVVVDTPKDNKNGSG